MPSPQILANSPKTFLDRDNWMRAVLAVNLPPIVRLVAIRIALHLHVESGRCDPGYDTLAAELGMSKRSIIRMVAMLEHTGWMEVTRPGHHQQNRFFLLRGDKAQSPLRGDKAVSPQNPSEVTDSNVRGDRISTSEVTHAVTLKAKRTAKRKAKGESDSPADFASRKKKKAASPQEGLFPETESKQQAPPKRKKGDRRSAADTDEAFERFWAAYPKRVAKEDARKAFAAALKRGAGAEALIAGAQRYGIERKDQDSKYTKHPATWLNKGCWEDELPGAPVIDEAGNLVAIEQPHREDESKGVYERYEEMAAVAYGGKSW